MLFVIFVDISTCTLHVHVDLTVIYMGNIEINRGNGLISKTKTWRCIMLFNGLKFSGWKGTRNERKQC